MSKSKSFPNRLSPYFRHLAGMKQRPEKMSVAFNPAHNRFRAGIEEIYWLCFHRKLTQALWDEYRNTDSYKFDVATLQDRVFGFSIDRKFDKVREIALIAVHPDYQHRGIGTGFIKRSIECLRKGRQEFITLEANPGPARPFFLKMGFLPTEEDPADLCYRYSPTRSS